MCSAYTNGFVHLGMIKKENRLNFSTLTPNISEKIDMNRSRNEIPLIEIGTGRVWYGIDALLEILIKEYLRRMRYAGIFPENKKKIALNVFALTAFLTYIMY